MFSPGIDGFEYAIRPIPVVRSSLTSSRSIEPAPGTADESPETGAAALSTLTQPQGFCEGYCRHSEAADRSDRLGGARRIQSIAVANPGGEIVNRRRSEQRSSAPLYSADTHRKEQRD